MTPTKLASVARPGKTASARTKSKGMAAKLGFSRVSFLRLLYSKATRWPDKSLVNLGTPLSRSIDPKNKWRGTPIIHFYRARPILDMNLSFIRLFGLPLLLTEEGRDMTPKRSRLEIYLDVLKAIGKGTHKPTRIMYRTNLSWKPMMKVFESLLDQDLIARYEEGGHATYRTTEKGRNVLRCFCQATDLLEVR